MSEELERSWYTKYRPKTLEEYSGPEIKNMVSKRFRDRSKFPHTIYIRGPRGTGKTTFARLISKFYHCQNPNDDGTPCEQCEMCQNLNEILIAGETGVEVPGVLEVDATTANGKEAIQSVIEDAIQTPIYTQYKIIIFDECHMITPQAQNSLLKVIEDIPSHLVCIFCTTNDEKVLNTIKSRMQLTIEAKKQNIKDMVNRLMQISEMEGLTVSKQALEAIAKSGDRVPRECINLLEAIANINDGEVSIENVRKHIGDTSDQVYIDYFNAANTSLTEILLCVKKLKTMSDEDITKFTKGLMQFAMDSLYIKHGIALDEYPPEHIKKVKELFNNYTSSEFDMLLQSLEYLTNNLSANNEARNEVLLTTTALRIGKIGLLANGLSSEPINAIEENKISLVEHSKKLKVDNERILQQLKTDLSLEDINETFDDVITIENTGGIFDSEPLPMIDTFVAEEKVEETTEEKVEQTDSIDDFFDD